MTNQFKAPKIPEKYSEFALKIADLMEEYSLDRCSVSFRPDFKSRFDIDHRLYGEFSMNIGLTDGRGRPAKNITLKLDSTYDLILSSTPESSS